MKSADKLNEKLMVLDENGNPTGVLQERSFVHQNNLFHNEAALWIIDKQNKKVLLQRRSPNKKSNPNKLAIVAGHCIGKQTLLETLKKETKEEIGLDISKYKVNILMTFKKTMPGNFCFSHHHYILANPKIEECKIQKEELSELLYIDYEELKSLVKQNSQQVVFKWNDDYKKLFKTLDNIILK